jgi:hypothetical protein
VSFLSVTPCIVSLCCEGQRGQSQSSEATICGRFGGAATEVCTGPIAYADRSGSAKQIFPRRAATRCSHWQIHLSELRLHTAVRIRKGHFLPRVR